MIEPSKLKEKIIKAIDNHRDQIIQFGEEILRTPETGFKEFKSSQKLADKLKDLGLTPERNLAITGVRTRIKSKTPGYTVAILGELDGIICPNAKFANPETGAAHVCGHNAQLASLLGVAIGLVKSQLMDYLTGEVVFLGTPSEEIIELAFREELRQNKKISFFGGKQELIHQKVFDDIDMAMVVHALPECPQRLAKMDISTNGFVGKRVDYIGQQAHAGMAPQKGINALNAASLGITAVNMQRETFNDQDYTRIHYIITECGKSVSIVPDKVSMEFHVRAKTMEAVKEAYLKVDRDLKGAATAIGAQVNIKNLPGYLPLAGNKKLSLLFQKNLSQLIGEENIAPGDHTGGATDMGDVSSVIPAIHPFMGGFKGKNHTPQFEIVDEEMAYIIPAKCMATSIVDLLSNKGQLAQQIKDSFVPKVKKQDYASFLNSLGLF